MRTSDLRMGTYLRFNSKQLGPCVVQITFIMDNDLVRYFKARCVKTGTEVTGGLYTEDDFSRIQCILSAEEVVALRDAGEPPA